MKYLITSNNFSPRIKLDDSVVLNSEDLNNMDKIVDSMVGVDVVLHMYELKGDHPDKQLFDENVWKTFGLVDAAIDAGVKKFIFLSSAVCFNGEQLFFTFDVIGFIYLYICCLLILQQLHLDPLLIFFRLICQA